MSGASSSRGVRGRGNAAGGGGGGASAVRVRAKLNAAMENGNYYEAHQMYRMLFYRLKMRCQYAELEEALYEGALNLAKVNELASSADLFKLYLEVLDKGKLECEEKLLQRIAKLYSLVPIDNPERDALLSEAVKWSKTGQQTASPRLHQLFAYSMWSAHRFTESRQHFLQSVDGEGCGAMLVEFQQSQGYPGEIDLFVTGTVLQLICLKKHLVAAFTLQSYTQKHPSIKRGPPYGHPLLNFVWLLLLAIEHKKSLAAFTILIEKYKPSIHRDPCFLEYLDKIGQLFFGVPPPARKPKGGMFGELFNSMLSMMNANDDSDEDASASTSGTRSAAGTSAAKPMQSDDLD